jgi:hypothetical protein
MFRARRAGAGGGGGWGWARFAEASGATFTQCGTFKWFFCSRLRCRNVSSRLVSSSLSSRTAGEETEHAVAAPELSVLPVPPLSRPLSLSAPATLQPEHGSMGILIKRAHEPGGDAQGPRGPTHGQGHQEGALQGVAQEGAREGQGGDARRVRAQGGEAVRRPRRAPVQPAGGIDCCNCCTAAMPCCPAARLRCPAALLHGCDALLPCCTAALMPCCPARRP